MRLTGLFILTIILSSCMAQTIRYEYADGSANRYILTSTQLEYVPVKPEESSTGLYSGGDPKTVTITKEQHQKLSELFDHALQATDIHIKDRMKTSGLVIRIDGKDQASCILQPKSDLMVKIEEDLKALIRN